MLMESQKERERYVSFIQCQFKATQEGQDTSKRKQIRPTITITRMTGSGGNLMANKIAELLQKRAPAECQWAVFDQNLVEKVLEEHNLPAEVGRFMPENKRSFINDVVEELIGLHPPTWTLVRQTAETILHLAEAGNAIIVGRAANVITSVLPNTFHVRLVGSFERRVERIMSLSKMSRKEAEHFVRREDEAKANYLKHYYNKDPDDPLLYHLIINTDLIPPEDAACIVCCAVINKFNLVEQKPCEPEISPAVL